MTAAPFAYGFRTFFLAAGPSGGEWNIGRGTNDDPERDLHYKAISTSVGLEWRLTSGTGGPRRHRNGP